MLSSMSVAPALKTSLKSPGEPPSPQSGPGLPDEKTGMIPAARQAWTVAQVERVVGTAAPRVVDDVGPLGRVGVVAVEVRRGEDPLAGGEERFLAAAEVLAALGRDPARAGRDAGVGRERAGAVAADHRAHRVGAMADVVARLAAADAGRVPPVVVMGERAVAVVAAVLVDERRVGEVDAGVDAGDDDALAEDALRPCLGRADLGDAPLGVAAGGLDAALDGTGLTSGYFFARGPL